jgi:hypothetical protein
LQLQDFSVQAPAFDRIADARDGQLVLRDRSASTTTR